jgi:hypothetical protein
MIHLNRDLVHRIRCDLEGEGTLLLVRCLVHESGYQREEVPLTVEKGILTSPQLPIGHGDQLGSYSTGAGGGGGSAVETEQPGRELHHAHLNL